MIRALQGRRIQKWVEGGQTDDGVRIQGLEMMAERGEADSQGPWKAGGE